MQARAPGREGNLWPTRPFGGGSRAPCVQAVRTGLVRESATMRKSAALPAILLAATLAAAAEPDPGLPRSTPEAQGVASSAILGFVEDTERSIDALHSLMVLRHGHVVAEGWWGPYERDDPHTLWSLTKSFTSTGIGLAVAEGKLSLDDTVLSFFPEDAPVEPSDNLKAMRVRDLLRMNTGQHGEDIDRFSFQPSDVPLTRAFLAMPVPHKPGTHFHYNTAASHMLSAILQKATAQPLSEYLAPRLLEPLSLPSSPTWVADAHGITMGGFGLSLRTEDVARFGQLYLQKGAWGDRRILPAAWVEEATALQTANGSDPLRDWDQGYGYQFWRCRHGVYRGDGAFGQYCIVMPEQDAVVAITSGVRDMQAVLNLVWERLLPAMQPAPLDADASTLRHLVEKLGSLTLPPQPGVSASPVSRAISGRMYVLPDNDGPFEAVGLQAGKETTLVVRSGGRERRLPCGHGAWRRSDTLPQGAGPRLPGLGEAPLAASGAWTADDTYTVKLCYYETSFCGTLSLRFAGDALHFDQEAHVAFGPTKRPQLVGRLEK